MDPKDKLIQGLADDVVGLSVDHEAIIKIQEKIIMAHEKTIQKEKLINKLQPGDSSKAMGLLFKPLVKYCKRRIKKDYKQPEVLN